MDVQSILGSNPLLPFSVGGFSPFCPSSPNRHMKCTIFGSLNRLRHNKVTTNEVNVLAMDKESSTTRSPATLRDGEERSGNSYNHTIRDYCRQGEIDKAMVVLAQREALGFHPSSISYAYLIEALGSVGRTLEADCLFQEMTFFGFVPRIKLYNVLLRGYLKKGLLGVGVRVLRVMDDLGIQRNRETYEILLDYFVNAGRLEDTWSIINEMKRKRFRLSSFVYSKVIALYRDNGMWKKAMDIVVEIREMGMSLDKHIYNSIIDTFGKYGELNEAMEMFKKMKLESFEPDIMTWNSLIRWHFKAGDINKALELFTEMQEEGLYPDPKVFLTIISRLGEQGKWDMIRKIFETMKHRGHKRSGAVYAVLVDIYGQYGKFRDAEECISALKSEGLLTSASIFCVIANAYAQQGQCDQTVKVLQLMEAEGIELNVVMLNVLMNAFGIAGRHLEALSIYHHIKEIGFSPDVVTYTTLMKAFIRAKKFDKDNHVTGDVRKKTEGIGIPDDHVGANGLACDSNLEVQMCLAGAEGWKVVESQKKKRRRRRNKGNGIPDNNVGGDGSACSNRREEISVVGPESNGDEIHGSRVLDNHVAEDEKKETLGSGPLDDNEGGDGLACNSNLEERNCLAGNEGEKKVVESQKKKRRKRSKGNGIPDNYVVGDGLACLNMSEQLANAAGTQSNGNKIDGNRVLDNHVAQDEKNRAKGSDASDDHEGANGLACQSNLIANCFAQIGGSKFVAPESQNQERNEGNRLVLNSREEFTVVWTIGNKILDDHVAEDGKTQTKGNGIPDDHASAHRLACHLNLEERNTLGNAEGEIAVVVESRKKRRKWKRGKGNNVADNHVAEDGQVGGLKSMEMVSSMDGTGGDDGGSGKTEEEAKKG